VRGNRPFRLLFAARTLSLAGSAIAPIALAFAVYGVTRSPAALGIVFGARYVPVVVFSLVGGVWADRVPRQRLLVSSDVLSAAVQAATGALVLTGHAEIWAIVVLQAFGGAAIAFFQPALGGAVAEIVAEEHRQRANALLGLSGSTTRIAGAAIGGLVVALLGAGPGLLFDAATFLGSAALLGRLGLAGTSAARRPMLRELAEGWSEFATRPWIWALSAQFAVLNAVGMAAYLVLGPLVAKRAYGGAASWGLIQAGLAVGFVAGGAFALRVRARRPLLWGPLAGFALVPVLALLAAGRSPVLVFAVVAVHGTLVTAYGALFETEIQNAIPADRLSRVVAYDIVVSMAFIPLGAPAVGAVASAAGTSSTLWAAAGIVGVASAAPLLVARVRGARAVSHLPIVRSA
jgi:MFS family permease